MRYLIFLVVLYALPYMVFAQSLSELNSIFKANNISKIDSILKKNNTQYEISNLMDIVDSYKHQYIIFRLNNDTYNYKIGFELINNKNRIIYRGSPRLFNQEMDEDSIIALIEDTRPRLYEYEFKKLNSAYKAIYRSDFSLDEFLRKYTYGSECGITGEDPELRIQMNKFIEMHQPNTLSSWLQSSNPIKQLYAVEAAYIMFNNGDKISNELLVIIDSIQQRHGIIYTCSGCLSFDEDMYDISKQFLIKH